MENEIRARERECEEKLRLAEAETRAVQKKLEQQVCYSHFDPFKHLITIRIYLIIAMLKISLLINFHHIFVI